MAEDRKDYIEIKWSWIDVFEQAKNHGNDLTRDECIDILELIKHHHDANEGVNWIVIDCHIDMYLDNKNKRS